MEIKPIRKPKLVRLDEAMLTRLNRISDATGHSVESIIRHLVDRGLPTLEARFPSQGDTENNSK